MLSLLIQYLTTEMDPLALHIYLAQCVKWNHRITQWPICVLDVFFCFQKYGEVEGDDTLQISVFIRGDAFPCKLQLGYAYVTPSMIHGSIHFVYIKSVLFISPLLLSAVYKTDE